MICPGVKKMKKISLSIFLASALSVTHAWAVPVLQVGAPAGAGDSGTYADYQGSTTSPTENDTAITSGGTLYVSGLYQQDDVYKLGGQYTNGSVTGLDWGDLSCGNGANAPACPNAFNDKGAILVVSLPETKLASAFSILQVGGMSAFLSDASESYFPNNHAPTNDPASGYLFFDIGDFSESVNVTNFSNEADVSTQLGEIKTLLLSGFDNAGLALPWAHFDVMALETSCDKDQGKCTTNVVSPVIQNNPGSHDVTWKPGDEGGGGGGGSIPEPASLLLMGAGLMSLGLARRRKTS